MLVMCVQTKRSGGERRDRQNEPDTRTTKVKALDFKYSLQKSYKSNSEETRDDKLYAFGRTCSESPI
jgi:hypothetical protein